MNTPDHESSAEQALRLAQLEIRMLREQLATALQHLPSAIDSASRNTSPRLTPRPPSAASPSPSGSGTMVEFKLPPGRPGARRVLCVEDSAANFQLIESILADRPGTDLLWADTGLKGVEMAKTNPPGLVLLDLDLPDIHGSEVLGHLRAEPATAETPVIVISADATPSQIERMLAAGASDYLTKPFEIRRFLLMFDEVFRQPATG